MIKVARLVNVGSPRNHLSFYHSESLTTEKRMDVVYKIGMLARKWLNAN